MRKQLFTVAAQSRIAKDTYEMRLSGNTGEITRPGQFINIALDGLYLRRPISVCEWTSEDLTIIYKVVGKGTLQMSRMEPGTMLDILSGLGNGYDTAACHGESVVLVGGGVGVPPLLGLARRLREQGENISAVLGFSDAESVFGIQELKSLDVPVSVSTVDGSMGVHGFVTDILKDHPYTYYYACGPQAMLAAVHKLGKRGQLSFEERMGCGFGACMGCTCHTLVGDKRVCVDGPVFASEEVAF